MIAAIPVSRRNDSPLDRIGAGSSEGSLFNYRARLSDGAWTDYVDPGEFVGTIGKGQDLTGFQFRFDEQFAARHTIRLAGAFRGVATPMEVGPDQPCVTPTGLGALYGIQISITPR